MSDRLLTSGSSGLEVAAAEACAKIETLPVPLRRLWSAQDCPAELLPFREQFMSTEMGAWQKAAPMSTHLPEPSRHSSDVPLLPPHTCGLQCRRLT